MKRKKEPAQTFARLSGQGMAERLGRRSPCLLYHGSTHPSRKSAEGALLMVGPWNGCNGTCVMAWT